MSKKYEQLNLHCMFGSVFFICLSITSSDHSFSLPGSHGKKIGQRNCKNLIYPLFTLVYTLFNTGSDCITSKIPGLTLIRKGKIFSVSDANKPLPLERHHLS